MVNFCLPKEYTDKFLKAIKDREINPEKLSDLSSEERRAFLEPFVGKENVSHVNALFESKLLLKNQKLGMIDWVKSVASLKPETKTDLITKIEKLDKVLSADSQQKFLEDLASKRLGTEVTFENAQKIVDLTDEIKAKKDAFLKDPTEENRIAMGRDMIDLIDYVKDINPSNQHLLAEIANLPRALMATADFSAPFRQGWGLMSNVEFWKALPEMFKYAASEDNYKSLQADLITRPNYELAKKAGLRLSAVAKDLTQREEDFTSRIFEKVPVLGRIFKASEFAYTGFLNKIRMDVFDNLVASAKLKGEDVSLGSNSARDIANVVNDFSGSGNIGVNDAQSGAVPALNAAFFAPRKMSAMINMLNPERYVNPKTSPTARRAALRNLVGSVGITAAVIGLARLSGNEDTTEENPLSSDFGKIKVNNTRYDVTGGNANFISLLARIFTNKTKSTSTGAVTKLGEGYKATTRADLAINFTKNKLAPLPGLVLQVLSGKDFNGKPINVPKEVLSRFYPLVIQDAITIAKDDKTQVFPAIVTSMLGVGVQNYNNSNNRDALIKKTYEKYGTNDPSAGLKDIYTSLEKESGKKLTDIQKTNISKQYAIYRKFGDNSDILDKALEIDNADNNDAKVEILQKLKKDDPEMYKKIISTGRTTTPTKGGGSPILISDDLYRKLILAK